MLSYFSLAYQQFQIADAIDANPACLSTRLPFPSNFNISYLPYTFLASLSTWLNRHTLSLHRESSDATIEPLPI
jgi:hypothetical protein